VTTHTIDREEVMAYVDGELAEGREAEVRLHLETCAECRALIGELRQVSTRLSSWHVGDPPGGLSRMKETLRAASPDHPSARSWWMNRGPFRLPRWSFAAGLALVTVILVVTTQFRRSLPVVANRQTAPVETRAAESREGAARPVAGSTFRSAANSAAPAPGYVQGERGDARSSPMTVPLQQPNGQQPDRMIVRSATISLTSDRFNDMRPAIDRLLAPHQGRIAALNVTGDPSTRRSLHATIRVPASELDALLAAIRALGRVQDESLGTDDVTESFRDLGLRTANARREEQRLVELLSRRTGDLADVLAVERELARVRLEIERMEAETRATQQRVDLATIELTVSEQYRADLAISEVPLSVQLKNALVDGSREAGKSLMNAMLFALQVAPTLMLWTLILFLPARSAWRRLRVAGWTDRRAD
jgi:anti-sigma factor RsiW